jgi:hypothetical protein
MSGCKPSCIGQVVGTSREKWDYVRAIYFPTPVETRDADDPARLADEAELDQLFGEDEAIWSTTYSGVGVPFEKFMQWYYQHGTYQYGNLGDFKKDDHVGHCFAPCPYDTACSDERTRHMLDLSDTDPLPLRTAHGIYYMRTESRGSKWGFECTYDSCPHYLSTGRRYFYV